MNTRLGPGGRVMAGAPADYSAGGVDTMIGQRQVANQNRGMTPGQRAYVGSTDAVMAQRAAAADAEMQMAPPPKPLMGQNYQGQRAYLPQQGTDGSIGSARFVQGTPTAGFRSGVARDPNTGGLALFGSQHEVGPSPSPQRVRELQAQGAANEWDRAAERAAQPGGSLQNRYRTAERERMARRGANMMAQRNGQSVRPKAMTDQNTAALTALRHQALQAHLQTLSPQEQLDYLDELLAAGGGSRRTGKKKEKTPASSGGPMLDSLGNALGFDPTPGKPLYPGRFGGY